MTNTPIKSIKDLEILRSAPALEKSQADALFIELLSICKEAEWFTVGIMAPTAKEAVESLRHVEKRLKLPSFKSVQVPTETGPVFLKANQKSGEFHIRIEYGLGEGILLSCQHDDTLPTQTLGPFPLDFFKK